MILGLGPVVRYELITTARRGRFYIAARQPTASLCSFCCGLGFKSSMRAIRKGQQ